MKVVCIGDSITYGYGVSRKGNWVSLLNEKSEGTFINKGIIGDTTSGMLSRFYRDVIEEKPKVVIIMGGTNDFIVENTLGAVRANVMSMVYQAYHNNIKPIVSTCLRIDINNIREDWRSITDIHQLEKSLCDYRDWVLKFCKVFNTQYIDLYAEFENRIGGDYRSYLTDGIHPSKDGNKIMADIVCEYMGISV